MIHIGNTKFWTNPSKIENSALVQIAVTEKHPRLFKHLAIMPDVHMGIGCTIGSVIALKDAIMPSAVGVDIGCGMCAMNTHQKLEDISPYFQKIYRKIKATIPVGFSHRNTRQMDGYQDILGGFDDLEESINYLQDMYPGKEVGPQIGTLGGGNHFIEMQVDKDNNVWIMIHSGSRNIGNKVATNFITKAKEICKDAPEDMEYLGPCSKEGFEYIIQMEHALNFAYCNRIVMLDDVVQAMIDSVPHKLIGIAKGLSTPINIHHNYTDLETHFGESVWVHRKGATKAVSSELGIIPGSMGTKSYIVRGKDCEDSYTSCSHGAGRTMSRTKARGRWHRKTGTFKTEGVLNVEDFRADMKGVYSNNIDRQHLDEAPRAYKDIDVVMENQKDLVDIEVELTPVFNIKG